MLADVAMDAVHQAHGVNSAVAQVIDQCMLVSGLKDFCKSWMCVLEKQNFTFQNFILMIFKPIMCDFSF